MRARVNCKTPILLITVIQVNENCYKRIIFVWEVLVVLQFPMQELSAILSIETTAYLVHWEGRSYSRWLIVSLRVMQKNVFCLKNLLNCI